MSPRTKASKASGLKKKTTCRSKHGEKAVQQVGVLYARTSSEGDKVQRSAARQFSHSSRAVKGAGKNVKVLKKVSEVVSGSLPLQGRDTLMNLLSGKIPGATSVDPRKLLVFVESARAVARDAMVGEQLYQASKATGARIVPADMPNLFSHNPTPAENFIRKIMMSVQELDRDQIIQRCSAGLDAKRLTSGRTTQCGRVKVNGSKSILESKPPNKKKMNMIKAAVKKYQCGRLALRPLASEIGKILKRKIHHETARRMAMEISTKQV